MSKTLNLSCDGWRFLANSFWGILVIKAEGEIDLRSVDAMSSISSSFEKLLPLSDWKRDCLLRDPLFFVRQRWLTGNTWLDEFPCPKVCCCWGKKTSSETSLRWASSSSTTNVWISVVFLVWPCIIWLLGRDISSSSNPATCSTEKCIPSSAFIWSSSTSSVQSSSSGTNTWYSLSNERISSFFWREHNSLPE